MIDFQSLTWVQWSVILAAIGFVITFLFFFIAPERTAVTFLYVFSTIRHGFRLRREVKGIPTTATKQAEANLTPKARLMGTLSEHMSTADRESLQAMERARTRKEFM